jgi:hypothetical protein
MHRPGKSWVGCFPTLGLGGAMIMGVGVFQVAFDAESVATISDNHHKERKGEKREGVYLRENTWEPSLCVRWPLEPALQPHINISHR